MQLDKAKPHWSRRERHILLSYEVPERINDSLFYPVKTPNGSEIILLGHHKGLTVIWRTLNHSSKSSNNTKSNTFDNDEDIYMEDEADEHSQFPETHVLDEDPSAVVNAFCNIYLESPVTHLAAPPAPLETAAHVTDSIPLILSRNIVVAFALLNGTIRLMTIALEPSNLAASHSVALSRTDVVLQDIAVITSASNTLRMCRALSMTWTSEDFQLVPDDKENMSVITPQNISNVEQTKARNWSLLVAAYEQEISGCLSIYSLGLDSTGISINEQPSISKPIQRHHMSGLVRHISFNPSRYPSERHGQLLGTDDQGCIRIYDCLAQSHNPGFASSASSNKGAWLASFYVPFMESREDEDTTTSISARKRILDAQWAFNGRSIVVLLSDGEWGIWDIDGIGPVLHQTASKQSNNTLSAGLSGAGVTSFAISSYIGDAESRAGLGGGGPGLSAQRHTSSSQAHDASKLSAMTPKTRKVKQDSLFSGLTQRSPIAVSSMGGISVSSWISSLSQSDATGDEYLIIWFGSSAYYTTSLFDYWQKAVNRSGKRLISGHQPAISGLNLQVFPHISMTNSSITKISQPRQRRRLDETPTSKVDCEVLAIADYQFDLLVPLDTKAVNQATTKAFRLRSHSNDMGASDSPPATRQPIEQELLKQGELSLGGLDFMLDQLDRSTLAVPNSASRFQQGSVAGKSFEQPPRKSVGFLPHMT